MIPLNSKVLVKVIEQHEESPLGLLILDRKTEIETCEVLSLPVGETEVQVGDIVLVPRDRMAVVVGGRIVDRKDLLAIVNR